MSLHWRRSWPLSRGCALPESGKTVLAFFCGQTFFAERKTVCPRAKLFWPVLLFWRGKNCSGRGNTHLETGSKPTQIDI
jgi:hypothetical protein